MNAEEIIASLDLKPLAIEGGYFSEIYRGTYGTSIYYLLRRGERSRWHKVGSDEIWYYHAGTPALQLIIHPDGRLKKTVIGPDAANGERPQSLIPGGAWQTAVLLPDSGPGWGLFGAAVFPAFEYDDFTGAEDAEIEARYPQLAAEIRKITLGEEIC